MYSRIPAKTLVEDYSWIWAEDPALDQDCEDAEGKPNFSERYKLYEETGDEKHLPIREGMEPVRWTLRLLRPRDVRRVRNEMEREQATATAWRVAASLAIRDVTGVPVDLAHVTEPRTGAKVLDPDVLDQLDAVPGLIDAIGSAAMRRAILAPK